MPQSLAQLYVNLIFSTKNRERWLTPDIRPEMHAYMGGILNRHDCRPAEINSEPDYVHVLLRLGRTIAMSDALAQRLDSPSAYSLKWPQYDSKNPL